MKRSLAMTFFVFSLYATSGFCSSEVQTCLNSDKSIKGDGNNLYMNLRCEGDAGVPFVDRFFEITLKPTATVKQVNSLIYDVKPSSVNISNLLRAEIGLPANELTLSFRNLSFLGGVKLYIQIWMKPFVESLFEGEIPLPAID